MSGSVPASGLFASLRRLLGTAAEIAEVRLELLGTELELEKQRIFDALLWAAIALVAFAIGLVMLCGFVILMVSDTYRVAVVGALALLLLLGGLLILRQAQRRLSSPSGLFGTSLAELKRDRSALAAENRREQL